MMHADRCCHCLDMRKGCLVIGYYQILQQIILMTSCLRSLFDEVLFLRNCSNVLYQESNFFFPLAKCLHIFIHLLYMTLTLLLLYGIHKDRLYYVKSYLISVSIFMVCYTMIYVTVHICADESEFDEMGIPLNIPLNIVFLLIIRSWWRRHTSKEFKVRTDV